MPSRISILLRVSLLLAAVVLIPLAGVLPTSRETTVSRSLDEQPKQVARPTLAFPSSSRSQVARADLAAAVASPTVASPTVASPTVTSLTVASPTVTSPTVASFRRVEPRWDEVQQELRSLGVQYMRLGSRQTAAGTTEYRFVCGLPVSEHAVYSRAFEARAADPLLAMREVLHQLRARRTSED